MSNRAASESSRDRRGTRLTRRRFLKGSLIVAPCVIPGTALGLSGSVAPSNRISLGLVGCGNHGTNWNLPQIFRNDDSQVVAVCDVDARRMNAAQKKVTDHYSRQLGRNYHGCRTFDDFRDLVRRADIDAVAVCTPDHWHILPALTAVKAGKDVICEKPLTLFVAEGRTLCTAVKRKNAIFQTASENRSIDTYIQLCELVRNGRIGTLEHIKVTLPGGNESRGENFQQRTVQPVPDYFNYDMWLGQAPQRPYIPARTHGSFRWFLDYSGGRITDWGAHLIDLAQWGNGTQTSGPVEVEGHGKFPPRDAVFNTAYEFSVDYRYANGVTLNVSSSQPGIRFEGSEGWIGFQGWRGPLAASDPKILTSKIGPQEEHLYRPRVVIARSDGSKGGEHRNFIDCVKSRTPCYAPAEIGHRTISIAHIGNISMLLGRKLKWDPDAERFVGDAQADGMLVRPQRPPWTLSNVDSWL